MARAVVVCCLFAVLALVCWRVKGDGVCREYNLGAFAAMLGKIQMEVSSFQRQIEAQRIENESQRKSIETLEKKNDDMREELASEKKKIEALKKTNDAVGFTVRQVNDVSSSEIMIFKYATTNTDTIYNLTNGVFTCKTPGHYYFSTSLLKEDTYSSCAYCDIYKNDKSLIRAHAKPGLETSSDTGYAIAVASVYVHLDAGDTVKLGGCTKVASWGKGHCSSFSGFLLTPDAA